MNLMFPEALVKIAAAGGGLDIDCSNRLITPDVMTRVAAAAAASGLKPIITFRNMQILLPEVAEMVANAGQGSVVFVI